MPSIWIDARPDVPPASMAAHAGIRPGPWSLPCVDVNIVVVGGDEDEGLFTRASRIASYVQKRTEKAAMFETREAWSPLQTERERERERE